VLTIFLQTAIVVDRKYGRCRISPAKINFNALSTACGLFRPLLFERLKIDVERQCTTHPTALERLREG
jgi:hypothetical protein